MRRQRLEGGSGNSALPSRTSVREALFFDVAPSESTGDDVLAGRRVRTFGNGPMLLASSHAVVGVTVLCYGLSGSPWSSIFSAVLPLLLAMLLDGAMGLFLKQYRRLNFAPHSVGRITMAYLAGSGVLWMLFAGAAARFGGMDQTSFLPLVLGAGLTMRSLVSFGSPPLSIINALVATVGAFLFSGSTEVTATIGVLSLLTVGYSVTVTRLMLANARRRFQLDHLAQKALHFVEEFEASGRGWFWETNSAGTLSYVSQQLADDFKTTPAALLGRQFTDLLSVDMEKSEDLREERTLGFHLSARFPFSDVVVRPASDEDVHWSLSGNPIFDDHGRFLGFRGIGTDLTEQRRSEQEISRLARYDSLTGLPNRPMMRQTLDEALRNAARRQRACSLFLIDLDRFKNVNDTLGHPAGDALLKQVAQRLTSVLGDHGKVGRLGGDEFKAVLPGAAEVGLIENLARSLITEVSRPYDIDGHRVTIGASVGIAIGDPGRACADSMIRNADLALYAAKAAGRGKHCFYESSMHSEATDRQMLENELRLALDRNELSVNYQPIVRVAGEEIAGFEALVRWHHPIRGSISPAKFIPLAEECGMIGTIGAWVLRTAVAEAVNWPENVRIAINLSPIQFNDPKIVEIVGETLNDSGITPDRVELEITEGVFLAEGDATEETFARLKKLGVRLVLDDFGTGYSSLGYLRHAPFDKIKIDQSFVRGAASVSSRNAALIRAIVTLAESLQMDTVAEGVETHDDLALIRDLGVAQVQGYIFGRPTDGEGAGLLAKASAVKADGHQFVRQPRQRLMRRAITAIQGQVREVRLRNISSTGALVECPIPVTPGMQIALDIVGVGPIGGVVRWSSKDRFGLQFDSEFDLARLAPKPTKRNDVSILRPWYVDQAAS